MASFQKMAGGRWRALVARRGVRKSRVFDTKQAAKDWAARQEYLILNAKAEAAKTPFSDVLHRYASEVSPLRRGERWEVLRLRSMSRDKIGAIEISKLAPPDLANWRDRRLQDVSAGTVAREMNLLSAVLTVARKEWGLISSNPISDIRKPKKPPPRNRMATQAEMEALALSAGSDLTNATARAFHAFLFACETAMRAGEIVGLTWENVNMTDRVAFLPMTKNGHARHVPLSSEAVRLIEALPKADPVFDLNSSQLESLWRKLRDRAAVHGLTFHDSRRMGTTKLAAKLEVLELAKVTGHRDVNMLLNTYYAADMGEIASKLD